jgi:hypothetical protein
MATRPVKQSLPADLPENWTDSQYVSPGGTEVGLTPQHGYNYLNRQVNAVQKAAQEIDAAFEDLAPLDHETKKIPKGYFPDDLGDYQPKTESLPVSQSLGMNDTVPFYSTADQQSKSITIAKLKSALGVQSPTISVIALIGTSLTCSDGTTTLTGTGSQEFSLPNTGTWTVTATYGSKTVSQVVEVTGALKYTVDLRIATKIEVTSNPTKTAYIVGDRFDPAGMVVKATFADGSTAVITDQVDYSPKTMTYGTTSVVVSATIGGQAYTASVAVTVSRIKVSAVPTQSGTLTYNGASQSPTLSGYDATKMTLSGTQSATNAGSYTMQASLKDDKYEWPDGTTTAKTVNWSIDKKAGSFTKDKTSIQITTNKKSDTITITREGTGAISASSDDTQVATTSVSGNVVTVTGVKSGNCVITINVAADTNHTAPESQTVNVHVRLISNTLNENTWADIKSVSDAGTGATYWNVGDYKNIQIHGAVQGMSLNGTMRAFILGFNHNSGKEGSNRIHFQIGKTTSGTDIAFCDSNYPNTGSSQGFRMNLSNTNSGGWNRSYGRNTLLGNSGTPTEPPANSFMAALSLDLRAVMKPVTKYTDNTGGGSNSSGAVTATTDYLFFLAEFEVQGARSYANQYEQNYQAQYDYYKAGNSKVKYRHDATGTAVYHWCRSARYGYSGAFCRVNTGGNASYDYAYTSYGLAPGFCV